MKAGTLHIAAGVALLLGSIASIFVLSGHEWAGCIAQVLAAPSGVLIRQRGY